MTKLAAAFATVAFLALPVAAHAAVGPAAKSSVESRAAPAAKPKPAMVLAGAKRP